MPEASARVMEREMEQGRAPADLRRCAELNERFLLMMESELLKRGIDTVLLFQRRNPKTGPWTPMRPYREENGGGFTDNSFMYRFTSK